MSDSPAAVPFRFSRLERSRQLPHSEKRPLTFPQRRDYVNRLIQEGQISEEAQLHDRPDLVREIHRHWHSTSQQGCHFATFLSATEDHVWDRVVVPGADRSEWDASQWAQLNTAVRQSIEDPETHALSIIFPAVTSVAGLIDLTLYFEHHLGWSLHHRVLQDDAEHGALTCAELRFPLNDDNVEAWPIGLGPFEFFPITRCSPMMEIAFVTKPKVFPLRPARLARDPGAENQKKEGHLADMPLGSLDEVAYGDLWDATVRRKRSVLADPRDPRAKAKMTLVIPTAAWEARLLIADEPDAT